MIYNPYPQVELKYGKDNKYFLQLFNSIMKVDRCFVKYKISCGENRFKYVDHLERVFAYELYRHWSNIIALDGEKLLLNGEINKVINKNKIQYRVDNSLNFEEVTLYPDLILHHSQSDDDSQLIVCEIKRNHQLSGSKILSDLYKISCYMAPDIFKNESKPFKFGVFILVGNSLSMINEYLNIDTEIKVDESTKLNLSDFANNEQLCNSFDRIVCVAYDGTNLEYDTLDVILSPYK